MIEWRQVTVPFKLAGTIPFSKETLAFADEMREALERANVEMGESIKDLLDGPRHGPTRGTLDRIYRERRYAERGINALREAGGRPAGPLRR